MNKSILIEMLGKLSPKEMKEFGEFVHSPFFNKNEGVIKLYEHLRKHYPDFDKEKIEKKKIYGKIFPGVEYNDGFMRTLMFNLSSLAEDYLSYSRFKQDCFADKYFLLYELNNREVDRLFEKNMKVMSKQLENVEVRDTDYFYNKFNIDNENLYYLGRTKLDRIEKIVKQSNPEDMLGNLTCYYLMNAMGLYTYFLNVMELYKFKFDTEQISGILRILKTDRYKDVPAVEVGYSVLMLFMQQDDSSYFFRTKDLLKKYENKLDRNQIHNTYLNLRNYCKRMIQKGRRGFLKELFDIYKLEIAHKLYALQRVMSFRYYTDVVETALKLNENEWALEFIEKYKAELEPDSMENTYFYSLALFEFAAKHFESSLELLSRVKYNDVYHKLKYRSLLLMLYYELDYGDQLLSHLDSFNHFLLNDSIISEDRKEFHSNFIKYIRSLSSLRGKGKRKELLAFKKKVQEAESVYNSEWLLEKIEELAD